jgi:hypothetical protein
MMFLLLGIFPVWLCGYYNEQRAIAATTKEALAGRFTYLLHESVA